MARALADNPEVSLPIRNILARLGERLHLYSAHGSVNPALAPAPPARETFFQPGLAADILGWLRLVPGLAARLQAEASIAELHCHEGEVCVLLAQAYESARVFGFDADAASLARARTAAAEAGAAHRLEFAPDASFGDRDYDLIILRDCPLSPQMLAEARGALSPMGVLLLVDSDCRHGEARLREADFRDVRVLYKSESRAVLQAE